MRNIQTTKPRPGAQVDWGHPFNDELMSWWLFNDGAGVGLIDIAGVNHGILTSMNPAQDWVGDRYGGALSFPGSDDHVELGTLDASGDAFSISCRFIVRSRPPNDYRLVSKATGTAANAHWWMLGGDFNGGVHRIRARRKTGGSTITVRANGGSAVDLNVWYTAHATYDGAQVRLYLDSEELPTGSSSKTGNVDTDPTVQVWIGANPTDSASPLDGSISDVRIWNRFVSTDEALDQIRYPYEGIEQRQSVTYFVPSGGVITAVRDMVGGFGLVPFAR